MLFLQYVLRSVTLVFVVGCAFVLPFSHSQAMEMLMTATFEIRQDGEPLTDAQVVAYGQSRTTDEEGVVQFEKVMLMPHEFVIRKDGQEIRQEVTATDSVEVIELTGEWGAISDPRVRGPSGHGGNAGSSAILEESRQGSLLQRFGVYGGTALVLGLGSLAVMVRYRRQLVYNRRNRKRVLAVGMILGLVVIGVLIFRGSQYTADTGHGQTTRTFASEIDNSLPQPKNVRVWADDRVATVAWDEPDNAEDHDIVGYAVRWGKTTDGALTNAKTTIFEATQIQPLENDVEYLVEVSSVQGSIEKRDVWKINGTSSFAKANGTVSQPVQRKVVPTSARVDAMRQRLTGFFDDFNLPAGNFDERKWNTAYTSCVQQSEVGAFINSQFHSHNQIKSTCDRSGTASRPRAIFNVAGATEENPAVIEFDFDGTTQPRDAWYIDLIEVGSRKNGIPLDITSHNDLFESDQNDPGHMLRMHQGHGGISLHFWNENQVPSKIPLDFTCNGWGDNVSLAWCKAREGRTTDKYSPLPQPDFAFPVIPNVRRHWVIEYSPEKIKIFIDGVQILEAKTPAIFADVEEFEVHNTLFSYNTGKQFTTVEIQTSLLHWDNFGFTGPAPTTVTHNYIDGGEDGKTPYIGRGTEENPVPARVERVSKIPIPDSLQGATKARVMFTIQPFSHYDYSWKEGDAVSINGTEVAIPSPLEQVRTPEKTGNKFGSYVPFANGVVIDPKLLKTGINEIKFNFRADIVNLHVEVDFPKGSAPAFTQPQDIYGRELFNASIVPRMREADMYWFIEQPMGLDYGIAQPLPTVPHNPDAPPTAAPSPTPTPILGEAPDVSATVVVPTAVYYNDPAGMKTRLTTSADTVVQALITVRDPQGVEEINSVHREIALSAGSPTELTDYIDLTESVPPGEFTIDVQVVEQVSGRVLVDESNVARFQLQAAPGATEVPGTEPEPTSPVATASPVITEPPEDPESTPSGNLTITPSPTVETGDPSSTPVPNEEPTEAEQPTQQPTGRPADDPSPTRRWVPQDPTNTPVAATTRPTEGPTVAPTVIPTEAPEPTDAETCPRKGEGDANCDDLVNLIDFEIFRQEYLDELNSSFADFNEDGKVSLIDAQIWVTTFLSGL